MKKYDIADAMKSLPQIIEEEVIRGEKVALTGERGHTVAVVMPMVIYNDYRRLKEKESGVRERPERTFADAIREFRARHTLEELEEMDIEGMLYNIRDRSPDGR